MKWSVGTQKNCVFEEKLPKKQDYKEYYFQSSAQILNNKKLPKIYLSTDNISIRPKEFTNQYDVKDTSSNIGLDFLEMKSK